MSREWPSNGPPIAEPGHDWEVDPIVPDGKPSTPQEFVDDARTRQVLSGVRSHGSVGVTSHGDDVVIFPLKDTPPR
ncbi:hypothetical protein ACFXG4_17615 [Nocardia sp. NPDC059246]|uniref:hypothetical protein n=1 Tax=Nocardia sp. NPDC059246 TaxID=3346789 RepID=UPI0036B0E1F9